MGWVHRRRDLGGVLFIHLRDREGVTQLVFRSDGDPAVHARAELLGSEYVIAVEGLVERRDADTVNAAIATGEVEVVVEKIWILNESKTPPFPMEENVDVKEDARLKYRYVDLRRPRMQRNIGYVWVPAALADPGNDLEIEWANGERSPAKTAAILFLDPQKTVPSA